MSSASEILRGRGSIHRRGFVLAGLSLAILKQGLDITLAATFFQHRWTVFNYWLPLGYVAALGSVTTGQRLYLLSFVALSVPFIWIGICLTLARLRDARLPGWMSLFFFVPFLNMVLFLFLCCTPAASASAGPILGAAHAHPWLDRLIPTSESGSAFAGAMLTLVFGLLLVLFSTNVLVRYGWGLFVGIPFAMGFFSVCIYCYHGLRSFGSCVLVACLSPLLLGLALLAYAIEGIICLVMAAPLAVVLSIMGGAFAYWLEFSRHTHAAAPAAMALLLVGLPVSIAVEP